MKIRLATENDYKAWDQYVDNHPEGNPYLLSGWGDAIRTVYGHSVYSLMAIDAKENVIGILPLVHIKHFVFGNNLFSMPFADLGGCLADNTDIEKTLIARACEIATSCNVTGFELRQSAALSDSTLPCDTVYRRQLSEKGQNPKVRMLLSLPETSDQLMASFKSKLRSQIRRPLKDGLHIRLGGNELMDDFYQVFAENMRDLASPVHAKKFIEEVSMKIEHVKFFIVYLEETPLACALVLGCGKMLFNPWASSLRRYSRMSPNMLLYWGMLEYACGNDFKFFDFGRSSLNEGTYKFKKQWGAEEKELNWSFCSKEDRISSTTEKSKFEMAMNVWKWLPVSITKVIGPAVRKNIGL